MTNANTSKPEVFKCSSFSCDVWEPDHLLSDDGRCADCARDRRLDTQIIDARTLRPLDGVPHPQLFRDARLGETVLARAQGGVWTMVQPGDLEWHMRHGHDVRAVRMVRGVAL